MKVLSCIAHWGASTAEGFQGLDLLLTSPQNAPFSSALISRYSPFVICFVVIILQKRAFTTFNWLRIEPNKCSYDPTICQVLKRSRMNKTMASWHTDASGQDLGELSFCVDTLSILPSFILTSPVCLLFLTTWSSSRAHSAISIQLWKDFPNTSHHQPLPGTPHSLALYSMSLC